MSGHVRSLVKFDCFEVGGKCLKPFTGKYIEIYMMFGCFAI